MWAGDRSTRSSADSTRKLASPSRILCSLRCAVIALSNRPADAAHPSRRQRALHREHGCAHSRSSRHGPRRRARVPRRDGDRASSTAGSATASHDSLTGLVNRREFEARLERALRAQRRMRPRTPCSISISTSSRSSTTPAATPQATRCSSRWGRCSRRRSAGATRLRGSAVTSSASCSESCTLDEALRTAETLRSAINDFKFTWDERSFRLGAEHRRRADHASDRRRRRAIDCRR